MIGSRRAVAGSLLGLLLAAACGGSGPDAAGGLPGPGLTRTPEGASSVAAVGLGGGSKGMGSNGVGSNGEVSTGVVSNVVDGDTVDVEGVGRIRVIGIDTPERGECGYESGTLAMAALVLGRSVTLVPGAAVDADRYGRLLRHVDVGSTDAGLSLIEDGWAIARYDSRDGYGAHPREAQYVAADEAAADRGCYPDDEP